MYQIATITPQEIAGIRVKNQDTIKALTGSKFDPVRGYEIIKKESNNFTEANDKALKADKLFAELLHRYGMTPGGETKGNKIRLQEQERARALELLELELQLAA